MIDLSLLSYPLSLNNIVLEPLGVQHESGLMDAVQDGNLWEIPVTSAPTPDKVVDYIKTAINESGRQAFTVINSDSGIIIGTTSYHDILPKARRLEIGYTWYARSCWRTHVNTTCKLILMQSAFETLDCLTVGWRTDIENHRSQKAIERLGAKQDGVIRGNRVRRDNTITDTLMYSMTLDEWTDAKKALEERLKGMTH